MAEGGGGKSKWSLDLDNKDFLKKAQDSKGAIQGIGDSKNLSGLTSGLMNASRLIGIVGAAALAVKASFETVFAAEEIKAVNQQFDVLAKNAGIAGDVIKEKLVKSTGGLVDDEAAIKAASEQVVKLGANASKLPEVMDLARKATNAFGGDMIEKFDQISSAIATGNMRQLKNLGIIIDQEKAYKDYAASIGKTIGMLSQEEKQRAALEAVLRKGEEAFKGIDGSAKEATLGWQKFTVTLGNLKDAMVLAFDKVMGPTVKNMISNLNFLAEAAENALVATFGEGSEKLKAQLKSAGDDVDKFRTQILEMEETGRDKLDSVWYKQLKINLDEAVQKQIQLNAELAKMEGPKKEASTTPGATETAPAGDQEKVLEQANKFNADLLKMQQQRLDQELANSTASVDEQGNIKYQGEVIQQEKIRLLHEQTLNQIRMIKDNDDLTGAQKKQMILEAEKIEHEAKIQMENEIKDIRQANLDKYVEGATNATQGVTRAFQAGSAQNKAALTDWGATGKLVFNSFKTNATQAFLAMGAGTKTAGEAIKGMMFGVVADTAEAKGQEMILAGIWPPNPPAIAGGAGLIALAGFLRSKAGGSAGGPIGSQGGGGGTSAATNAVAQDSPEVKEAPKKAVAINVQGSYFETEQTQRRLVELIRQESDATDFSFRQIGS